MTLQRGADMQVVQVSHRIDGEQAEIVMTQLTGQGAQVYRGPSPALRTSRL